MLDASERASNAEQCRLYCLPSAHLTPHTSDFTPRIHLQQHSSHAPPPLHDQSRRLVFSTHDVAEAKHSTDEHEDEIEPVNPLVEAASSGSSVTPSTTSSRPSSSSRANSRSLSRSNSRGGATGGVEPLDSPSQEEAEVIVVDEHVSGVYQVRGPAEVGPRKKMEVLGWGHRRVSVQTEDSPTANSVGSRDGFPNDDGNGGGGGGDGEEDKRYGGEDYGYDDDERGEAKGGADRGDEGKRWQGEEQGEDDEGERRDMAGYAEDKASPGGDDVTWSETEDEMSEPEGVVGDSPAPRMASPGAPRLSDEAVPAMVDTPSDRGSVGMAAGSGLGDTIGSKAGSEIPEEGWLTRGGDWANESGDDEYEDEYDHDHDHDYELDFDDDGEGDGGAEGGVGVDVGGATGGGSMVPMPPTMDASGSWSNMSEVLERQAHELEDIADR